MPDKIECDPKTMQLLAGLAHELNTPLGAIKSNNEVIDLAFTKVKEWMKKLPETAQQSEMEELLGIIAGSVRTNRLACERLIGIVHNVRQFARLEDADRKKTDIHQGIDSTLALLAHELKHRITVVKEYGQLREIDGYPSQLHQVLMNILLNAIQAIDGEGEIHIKTWEADNAVHIAIADTGRGIATDVQPRIFDLGFTTKKVELGTGLGLAICQKVMQNHGGRIEVFSEAGRGTTFTLVLPVFQDPERKANG